MSLHRLATGLCLSLLMLALPVRADEPRGEPAAEVQEGGIFRLIPADAVTEHKLPTETGPSPIARRPARSISMARTAR